MKWCQVPAWWISGLPGSSDWPRSNVTINTCFWPNQPHKGPLWTHSPAFMCWKFENWLKVSREIIPSANNWLILFKQRFGMMPRSKVTINTYFWPNTLQNGPPWTPLVMYWKFENWLKVSREFVSSANNWLIFFKHRFGIRQRSKVTMNTSFLPNQPYKGPPCTPLDVLEIWLLIKSFYRDRI